MRSRKREVFTPRRPSIEAGATFDVVIERILPGGAGLAHANGQTVLVGLAAPGDHLRVRVERHRGTVAFASISDIIEPSPKRVTPGCEYFGRCGGCDFQQLRYEAQLDAKVEIIRDCLRRIAHIDFHGDIPITPSPNPWQYRSSAQWKHDPIKSHFGYFERGSHTVCDVVECPILTPPLQKTLHNLRRRLIEGTLPLNEKEFEAVAGGEGVSVFPPIDDVDVLDITRSISGDQYGFSADGFFQINQELLPALIDAATHDANGETALDLYCGVGLFTLPLARRFIRVVGVEVNSKAVSSARRNLSGAKLVNALVEHATVANWLEESAASYAPLDFILLDPPRTGAEKGVIEGILAARPRRITYVSCDPATLARDLRGLISDGGYTLDSVAAFDMFPQTHHVETVACMSGVAS